MTDFDLEELDDSLSTKDIILVLAESGDLKQVNTEVVRYLSEKRDAKTVYITVAKPYNNMTNIMEKEGINTSGIFFIDCITKTTSEEEPDADNCVFLRPQALTDISIALSQAIDSLEEDQEKYLFIDNLGTLMLYNDGNAVGKFAHSLINKIRKWGIKSIMLTLEEETDEEIINQVRQFCDETISLKDRK